MTQHTPEIYAPEFGECNYRAAELRWLLRQWNALGGDEMRATVADAAGTLDRAGALIPTLLAALKRAEQLLRDLNCAEGETLQAVRDAIKEAEAAP